MVGVIMIFLSMCRPDRGAAARSMRLLRLRFHQRHAVVANVFHEQLELLPC
jgi:hypothetical protein